MEDQSPDWLDEQLAMNNYINDEGFSARVISQLPKGRPHRVVTLRWSILCLSVVAAVCLLVGLAVGQILPLLHGINQPAAMNSAAHALKGTMAQMQQPIFLAGMAACIALIVFASIPLLRRWV